MRGAVQTEHPIPLFERLLVETQANCNRDCWFCARTYDRTGKYLDAHGRASLARVPTERVIDLLDQAAVLGFTGEVGFHHFSEPLLDDRNIRFAREARARDMRPYLHTLKALPRYNDKPPESLRCRGLFLWRSVRLLSSGYLLVASRACAWP
jgi:hypothetical protein